MIRQQYECTICTATILVERNAELEGWHEGYVRLITDDHPEYFHLCPSCSDTVRKVLGLDSESVAVDA